MEAGTFRKRPLVVEAVQLGTMNGWQVAEWCGGEFTGAGVLVPTIHGQIKAHAGDWVIRGTHGEFYPVVPDVFADLYEPEDAA